MKMMKAYSENWQFFNVFDDWQGLTLIIYIAFIVRFRMGKEKWLNLHPENKQRNEINYSLIVKNVIFINTASPNP